MNFKNNRSKLLFAFALVVLILVAAIVLLKLPPPKEYYYTLRTRYAPIRDVFRNNPTSTKIYMEAYQKNATDSIRLFCRAVDGGNHVLGTPFNITPSGSNTPENPNDIGAIRIKQHFLRHFFLDSLIRIYNHDPETITFVPSTVSINGVLCHVYYLYFDGTPMKAYPDPCPPAAPPSFDLNSGRIY